MALTGCATSGDLGLTGVFAEGVNGGLPGAVLVLAVKGGSAGWHVAVVRTPSAGSIHPLPGVFIMKLLPELQFCKIPGLSPLPPSIQQAAVPVSYTRCLLIPSPGGCIKCGSAHRFNSHCVFLQPLAWPSVHETIPALFQCRGLLCGGWWQCCAWSLWSLSELVCWHLCEELKPKVSPFRGSESHHYWREFREEWKKWLGARRDWCMRRDKRG